jgi:hypothetical protein
MEQVQERKTRERITAYRDLVTRAAAGEQLRDDDLTTASDLLDALGLPPYAWARDVAGKREDDAAAVDEARHRDAEPARMEREKDLGAKVAALEAELKALREQLQDAARREPMRLLTVLRRRNELRANHPHVLGDLEQAVAFRLQEKRKGTTTPTPMPTGSVHEGWSE